MEDILHSFIKYGYHDLKLQLPPIKDIIGICVAEFLGSLLLIIFGCTSFLNGKILSQSDDGENDMLSWFILAIAYGNIVMVLTTCFIQVSGALLNPVVTIWALIYGIIPKLLAPLYIVCQFIGAIVGFGIFKSMMSPIYVQGTCVNALNTDVNVGQGLLTEILTTAILIFVYCGVWNHRSKRYLDACPLKIGFTYTLLEMVSGLITQCGMNPARSFAAAIYNNEWNGHWIYWIGPIIGSIMSSFLYLMVLEPDPEVLIKKAKIKNEFESKIDRSYKSKVKQQIIEENRLRKQN